MHKKPIDPISYRAVSSLSLSSLFGTRFVFLLLVRGVRASICARLFVVAGFLFATTTTTTVVHLYFGTLCCCVHCFKRLAADFGMCNNSLALNGAYRQITYARMLAFESNAIERGHKSGLGEGFSSFVFAVPFFCFLARAAFLVANKNQTRILAKENAISAHFMCVSFIFHFVCVHVFFS